MPNYDSNPAGEIDKFLDGTAISQVIPPERVEALDNLLVLYGLQRHPNVYGGGILVYHHSDPSNSYWLECFLSDEAWLERLIDMTRLR